MAGRVGGVMCITPAVGAKARGGGWACGPSSGARVRPMRKVYQPHEPCGNSPRRWSGADVANFRMTIGGPMQLMVWLTTLCGGQPSASGPSFQHPPPCLLVGTQPEQTTRKREAWICTPLARHVVQNLSLNEGPALIGTGTHAGVVPPDSRCPQQTACPLSMCPSAMRAGTGGRSAISLVGDGRWGKISAV